MASTLSCKAKMPLGPVWLFLLTSEVWGHLHTLLVIQCELFYPKLEISGQRVIKPPGVSHLIFKIVLQEAYSCFSIRIQLVSVSEKPPIQNHKGCHQLEARGSKWQNHQPQKLVLSAVLNGSQKLWACFCVRG